MEKDPLVYTTTIVETLESYTSAIKGANFEKGIGLLASLERVFQGGKCNESGCHEVCQQKRCRRFVGALRTAPCKVGIPKATTFAELVTNSPERRSQKASTTSSTAWFAFGILYFFCSQMKVFQYVEEKDVFDNTYAKLFVRRLLTGKALPNVELAIINALKELCGAEFSLRLERLFTDVNLSGELSSSVHEIDVKVSVLVFGKRDWPLSQVGLAL